MDKCVSLSAWVWCIRRRKLDKRKELDEADRRRFDGLSQEVADARIEA